MITVIKNVRIMQTHTPVEVVENQDVVIKDDLIENVGKGISSSVKADKVINGEGLTLMPGNICAHHHYYSGLARGMLISAGPQTDFIQVLKEWWWRLDRGLDEESLYYSSLVCSLDAIASGTTTCIDHHESPNFISGSLSVLEKGMNEIGIRGVVAYGITDRNYGMKEIKDGVEEGNRFAKEVDNKKKKGPVMVEAMIGAHAPFTVPNEGLEMLKDSQKSTSRGLHIHVAEAEYDVIHSHHIYNMDIIDRLDKYGLLNNKTLLVHGVHLNSREVEKLNAKGCYLAHNGRSNMNNNIGYCKNIEKVKNLLIGTDGCGGNMFEELKCAFLKHKDNGGSYWPSNYLEALSRANDFISPIFNKKFGRIEKGYTADLVLLNYNNPTPLVKDNVGGHFVWGMGSGCVQTVLVNGKTIMENREFVGIDAKKIYEKASQVAKKLWERTDKIKS